MQYLFVFGWLINILVSPQSLDCLLSCISSVYGEKGISCFHFSDALGGQVESG